MKIPAVCIKNPASLEGSAGIDLTTKPLCPAEIFAATGAPRPEKSTIFEELCLSCYQHATRREQTV